MFWLIPLPFSNSSTHSRVQVCDNNEFERRRRNDENIINNNNNSSINRGIGIRRSRSGSRSGNRSESDRSNRNQNAISEILLHRLSRNVLELFIQGVIIKKYDIKKRKWGRNKKCLKFDSKLMYLCFENYNKNNNKSSNKTENNAKFLGIQDIKDIIPIGKPMQRTFELIGQRNIHIRFQMKTHTLYLQWARAFQLLIEQIKLYHQTEFNAF